MARAGIKFEVIESGADETIDGDPGAQAEALAVRKARAVLAQISGDAIIVAADTIVAIDGQVLGKPADAAEAFYMLKTLQGRRHTVYTGVALLKTGMEGEHLRSFVDSADVFFHPLTNDKINSYIATGEPFDKAGGYGVQDRGGEFIERIDGDFFTVMGLPMARLNAALSEMSN